MDANGLRSFGLTLDSGLYPWPVDDDRGQAASGVEASTGHRVRAIRLASRADRSDALVETASQVGDVVLSPALAVDAVGNHVRWDGARLISVSHLAGSHMLAPLALRLPDDALPVTDLAPGADDVLYLVGNGAVWLADLRARFALARLAPPAGFNPQRITAAAGGGAWVLDAGAGRLARVHGLPPYSAPIYVDRPRSNLFQAADPGPRPLRWRLAPAALPADERAVAFAANAAGRLAVLSLYRGGGGTLGGARLRLVTDDGRWSAALTLAGPRFPSTLGWVDADHLALATRGRLQGARAARDPGVWVYELAVASQDALLATADGASLPADLAAPLQPGGDYYPLTGWTGGPFVNHRPGERLHYPRQTDAGPMPARVARVSLAARSRYGVVANTAATLTPGARVRAAAGLIDTRDPGTVWHRLYAQAHVPTGCALLVWLAASDSAPPQFVVGASTQAAEWAPHLIGDASTLPTDLAAALPVDLPRAAWSAQASEVALGQGLLGCAAEPGRAGRFELLIQRAGRQVRALRGQRLWVAVELFGDGRASPELVALRAWAGRFSYRDHYLPALYHERQFGSDADQVGTASGADFLDRFLAIFEGLFTDIEGRIAAAALVTDAIACPADALPWLAGWVGLGLEPGLAPERRRLMLADAATLARQRGTLAGLKRALDLVSGGAVTRGQVVVVENFRLRRTLATLLGVQFADASDPLTAGISQSGNSVVGDTLFLGDPKSLDEGALKTFLALFRHLAPADAADAATLQADRAAAQRALYDDLAHRVTVLIHDRLPGDDAALVRRVADHAAPAHVVVSVVEADYPFMVGIASLIGADTYLSAKPTPQPVRVGPGDPTSALGGVDSLRGEGSLDAWAGAFEGVLPRADDRSPPPLARASLLGGADAVDNSKPFVLDGSASSAADGQVITLYTWTHLPDS